MQSKQMAKSKPGPATQRYLDIAEIRDDLVIMKDGTVRGVLMVSSINFALKSVDEQEATIQAYMSFLNSLEYPIQIVIQSRKMNIDAYLESLNEQYKKSVNDLLRAQILDYRNFVQELVSLGEIMQKRFYVVVPYDPISNKKKNFFSRLSEAISPVAAAKLSNKQMKDRLDQLGRRLEMTAGQLESMGLQVARLDTQSLIELYYTAYNPDLFEDQKLDDISKIRTD
ncbi:TraC family protein [Patescibacteria group bacterium]|nr:TraC family protein [Patescibacteria group bacterium]MBU1705729.1 TraC family protein [Patescibacteria group bacterium]